eukprot:m.43981 g.43981  ORF g.43981 m.43981 type:complete len:440 (-) comp12981_c0_seq1:33-1352(-)
MATLGQLKSTRLPTARSDASGSSNQRHEPPWSINAEMLSTRNKSARSDHARYSTGVSHKIRDVAGVSTVAKQRRARRAIEREEHRQAQLAREEEECSLLYTRIAQLQSVLTTTLSRLDALRQSNSQLIHQIESRDRTSLAKVSSTVTHYTKCLKSVNQLAAHSKVSQACAESESTTQLAILDNAADGLVTQLKQLDLQLDEAFHELDELLEYKERGQFQLREKVFELKADLNQLQAQQAQELTALKGSYDAMYDELDKSQMDRTIAVKAAATQRVLDQLPPHLRARNADNIRLRQELTTQTSANQQLARENEALQAQLRCLQNDVQQLELDRKSRQRTLIDTTVSLPALSQTSLLSFDPAQRSVSSQVIALACGQATTTCSRTASILTQIDAVLEEHSLTSNDATAEPDCHAGETLLQWDPMGLIATESTPVTMKDMFG